MSKTLVWLALITAVAVAAARAASNAGGHNGPEFSVGQRICFTGAPGDPANAQPVWIVAVLEEGYRWGLNMGGEIVEQGFIPFGFIDSYRAAGGTVQLCPGV